MSRNSKLQAHSLEVLPGFRRNASYRTIQAFTDTDSFKLQSKFRTTKLNSQASTRQTVVTPQIAVQVVRQQILPMFSKSHAKKGAVLQQLCLADQLDQQLQASLSQVNSLQEQIDHLRSSYQCQLKQTAALNLKLSQYKQSKRITESKLEQQRNQIIAQRKTISQQHHLIQELTDFTANQLSEIESQQSTLHRLSQQKTALQQSNQYLTYSVMLLQHQYDVCVEQTSALFSAVAQLDSHKTPHAKHTTQLTLLTNLNESLVKENTTLNEQQVNKQQFLDDVIAKNQQLTQKFLQTLEQFSNFKERSYKLRKQQSHKQDQLQLQLTQLQSVVQDKKMCEHQNEALKRRIQQMRAGGFTNVKLAICGRCNKEFTEANNFNWSCRTHQYEFSGQQWWCCGKTYSDALGCKFSKHKVRHFNEDKFEMAKDMTCQCCKQSGHVIRDCPLDPNLKTVSTYELEIEGQRVQRLDRKQKHYYSDSHLQTARLLKRCAISEDGVFGRNIMDFDDYNYGLFNQYILVKNPAQLNEAALHQLQDSEEQVYFKQNEINQIKKNQNYDTFKDLHKLREPSQVKNAVNVMDHVPKPKQILRQTKVKLIRKKSVVDEAFGAVQGEIHFDPEQVQVEKEINDLIRLRQQVWHRDSD